MALICCITNFIKISLNRGGSYIDSPKWLKNRKAIINPKNNDDRCFQYAVTGAKKEYQTLNHLLINMIGKKQIFDQIKKAERSLNQNNKSIALNILHVPYNTEEIRHAYKSKYNLNCKNQVILLMITDGKKLHYLTVKILSALLRRITLKHVGDFYCLNYFYSYSTKDKIWKT